MTALVVHFYVKTSRRLSRRLVAPVWRVSSGLELFDRMMRLPQRRDIEQIAVLRRRPKKARGRLPRYYVVACYPEYVGTQRRCVAAARPPIHLDHLLLWRVPGSAEGRQRLAAHLEEVAAYCWRQAEEMVSERLIEAGKERGGGG